MIVPVLVTIGWLLYLVPTLVRVRADQGVPWRGAEAVGALWATVSLATAAAVEVALETETLWLWAEVLLTAGAVAVILLSSWWRFRGHRFAGSFGVDFSLCFLSVSVLVAVLLLLAARMVEHDPFGALITGVLSFFFSVNALAEVFRAGRDSTRWGKRSARRRGPQNRCE